MAVDAERPNFFQRMALFYREVIAEMKRVTWPDKPQIRSATIGIIIFVLFVGAIITLMDIILRTLLVRLIPALFT